MQRGKKHGCHHTPFRSEMCHYQTITLYGGLVVQAYIGLHLGILGILITDSIAAVTSVLP